MTGYGRAWAAAALLLTVTVSFTAWLWLQTRSPAPSAQPGAPAVVAAPVAPPPPEVPPPPQRMPAEPGAVHIMLSRRSGLAMHSFTPLGPAMLVDGVTGKKIRSLPAGRSVRVAADYASGRVRVETVAGPTTRPVLEVTSSLIRLGAGRYPDRLRIDLDGEGLRFINTLDIEKYLEGVLPGELPRSFHPEAQKALAVAARSYTLAQEGKHGLADLCDGTHCQMYLGIQRASRRALAALRSTRREIVSYAGRACFAFYSADCGGISTEARYVPLLDKPADDEAPYLAVVSDRTSTGYYCARSPFHRWIVRRTGKQLGELLAEETGWGSAVVTEVRLDEVDPTGRALTVTVLAQPAAADGELLDDGDAPLIHQFTGWRFRNLVGPYTLRATLFTVDQPEPGVFRFLGAGNGHGLGLCQYGADGMGRRGFNYRKILAHYYPGSQLTTVE